MAELGIRTELKILRLRSCRFDPDHSHHFSKGLYYNQDASIMSDMKELTDEQRDALEEQAQSEDFKKFIDAEEAKERELAEHPYTRNKRILDEEFRLEISYPKNGVAVGTIDAEGRPEGIPIIESILEYENPGALITNDLYIIDITPDVDVLIMGEDTSIGSFSKEPAVTKDYIIHEYRRIGS